METRELIPQSPKRDNAKDEQQRTRTKIAETFGTNPRLLRKQVEAERAKVRQSQLNNKTSLMENFPQAEKGTSRDKAAETVGIGSGKTAEKGMVGNTPMLR